MNEAMKILRIL